MANLVPPVPIEIPDQTDFRWTEWYKEVRNRTNLPIVDGNIILSTTNYIKGGQTDYDTGVGFFLGYSGGAYKFSLGDSAGTKMTWDGMNLNVTGGTITGSTIQTASSGKRIKINSDGIIMYTGVGSGLYNTFKYGSGIKYGASVLAYINNAAQAVPFYVKGEQTVADFHFFNRSSDPSGAAEVGDVCVVNGKLKICTTAGTPGTWTIVGTQT